MATWDDVARTCLALPETSEGLSRGWRQWKVRDKSFVWERPLSKKDRTLLTEAGEIEVPPDEVILAARVEDLAEKEAVLAEHDATFTTPHFDGYPALLVALDEVTVDVLEELVTEAWRCRAGVRALQAYDAG